MFSNISLLIDNLSIQKGNISKKVADFALLTYVEHIKIDTKQAKELIELLEDKYKVSSQRGINLIIERIKAVLECNGEELKEELIEQKEMSHIMQVQPKK